jgi:MFS family permease
LHYQIPKLNWDNRPDVFYGYKIVTSCYVITMIVWGTYNSFGVFFNSLLAEFHWSRAIISGAFSLCTVLSGLAAIPFGRITDKFGPRRIMTACSLLLGTGYILMSEINSVWQFYLIYGVMIGVGTGGFWVPVLSTISRWFSQKRGLMVGIVLSGSGAGTLIFPSLANWLISHYQWRLSITIVGMLTTIIGVSIAQFIKRSPIDAKPFYKENAPTLDILNQSSGYSLGKAARTVQFWIAVTIFFCCGFYGYATLVHIIPQTIDLGIPAAASAGILSVIGGISIPGGLLTGALADRIGVKKTLILFIALATAALVWLIFARFNWQLFLFAILFGLTYGSIGVSETVVSVWLFGLKANALILSIIDFGLTLGAASGPLITGYIFDVTESYQTAFILTAALSIGGLVLVLLLRPLKAFSGGK